MPQKKTQRMRRQRPHALSAMALTLALTPAVFAHAGALELAPGVLLDSDTAYVMRPQGGIAAVNLGDGQTRWRSGSADRPVSIDNGRLLAQVANAGKGALSLLLVDAADGTSLQPLDVTLPSNVTAGVVDGLHSRFALSTENRGAADELVWRHNFRLVQGMPSTADTGPVRTAGVVDVDFVAGKATASSRAAPARRRADYQAPPRTVAADGRMFYSQDRRHVLASTPNESSELAARYRWQVFEAGGKRLGAFDSAVSFTPFVVHDGMLLHVTPARSERVGERLLDAPRSLRAVALERGAEAWQVALRETAYTGPFPP